jgi:sodium/potassium/calcium exchanger 4
LDQDVAGATFMAAGSSAPEVFISLVGIIVGETNPSIGSIVGSAIFNILFVIGLCGLFIAGTARLTIWPFFRDSIFYCVAILLLVLVRG